MTPVPFVFAVLVCALLLFGGLTLPRDAGPVPLLGFRLRLSVGSPLNLPSQSDCEKVMLTPLLTFSVLVIGDGLLDDVELDRLKLE